MTNVGLNGRLKQEKRICVTVQDDPENRHRPEQYYLKGNYNFDERKI